MTTLLTFLTKKILGLRLLAACVLVAATASPVLGANDDGIKLTDRELALFDRLTVSNVVSSLYENRLFRWVKPIRIRVFMEKRSNSLVSMVKSSVTQISESTNYDIAYASNGTINFVLVFSDDIYAAAKGKFRKIFQQLFVDPSTLDEKVDGFRETGDSCFAQIGLNHFQIGGSMAFISTKQSNKNLLWCINRMLMYSLGFFAQQDEKEKTVLNRSKAFFQFTQIDKHLMMALYSPALDVGWKREKVLSQLRQ